MSNYTSPNRYDFVGSFLRPAVLREARAKFEAGELSREELTKIEDEKIRELVEKEKKAGYHLITDGEFRRLTWHLDFMWEFDGVAHKKTEKGIPFYGEDALIDDTYLVGKVALTKKHSFIDHFKFLQELEDENTTAKLTIPAPAQFLEQMIISGADKITKNFYDNTDDLIEDIALAYRKFIAEVYEAGCRNLQFDDCSWGVCVDPIAPVLFDTDQEGLDGVMEQLLRVNNLAIEGKPEDLTITTHVCRGNFHSTYASSGAYDRVAKFLFARENVSAFFLEFDDARSGGFEPLSYVPADKKVVLGLVTTKSSVLENKNKIIERIHEAEKYLPLDQLYLSPQCGFASCEIGNKLTEAQQWAKLALVKDIAEEVWK